MKSIQEVTVSSLYQYVESESLLVLMIIRLETCYLPRDDAACQSKIPDHWPSSAYLCRPAPLRAQSPLYKAHNSMSQWVFLRKAWRSVERAHSQLKGDRKDVWPELNRAPLPTLCYFWEPYLTETSETTGNKYIEHSEDVTATWTTINRPDSWRDSEIVVKKGDKRRYSDQ